MGVGGDRHPCIQFTNETTLNTIFLRAKHKHQQKSVYKLILLIPLVFCVTFCVSVVILLQFVLRNE